MGLEVPAFDCVIKRYYPLTTFLLLKINLLWFRRKEY